MKYPMKLVPAYKDYLWGGTRLKEEFGKQSELAKLAESWELSCHPDGLSVISNGPLAGATLADYVKTAGIGALGAHCRELDRFPVLIKLIDAKQDLSIQVHPNDEYALLKEGEPGKTEMWLIVDCEPGASLVYGFSRKLSKAEFAERIRLGTLTDVLNRVPVHKGDVFFIEAGTLHAIGAGILIAEIQQNSNTTYRVYDYGRLGADGKPRALHVEKALDVTTLTPAPRTDTPRPAEQAAGFSRTRLAHCRYFTVDRYELTQSAALCAGEESFHSLLCLEGGCTVRCAETEIVLAKGESAFLPAGCGAYTVLGAASFLLTTV